MKLSSGYRQRELALNDAYLRRDHRQTREGANSETRGTEQLRGHVKEMQSLQNARYCCVQVSIPLSVKYKVRIALDYSDYPSALILNADASLTLGYKVATNLDHTLDYEADCTLSSSNYGPAVAYETASTIDFSNLCLTLSAILMSLIATSSLFRFKFFRPTVALSFDSDLVLDHEIDFARGF
ncbi:hypothetical protein EVAR_16725_1 [Eumeta japonica]|uniref:Uncharacterized protein n=1 Tax=Eumeta variegata TaxID=151549 RepID=A0A4C1V616_EUMVA|nr:hypothetical protein EVAR_16725_1 [Eumeta japonica]